MAQSSRSIRLLRKAEAALFAGIEIDNKLDFKYREQAFAILRFNACGRLSEATLVSDLQQSDSERWTGRRENAGTIHAQGHPLGAT